MTKTTTIAAGLLSALSIATAAWAEPVNYTWSGPGINTQHGAEIGDQVGDPDDGQPEVGVPFRLRVLLALGDAEQVAGRGDQDEELVSQQDEPGQRLAAEQAGAAGALHDVKSSADQCRAPEGEDRRRRVQRPQPAEGQEFRVEAELRPDKLGGNNDADQEGGNSPEGGEHYGGADDILDVARRRPNGLQSGLAGHSRSRR